ncbi:uncharacterized protein V1518DRAFT_414672, partial [Limtongia smithiae]|uniref:uncharacterized protein n=1 Tax=Limtongia smithiae TaxID=1125753 RepID=UPI0034CF6622
MIWNHRHVPQASTTWISLPSFASASTLTLLSELETRLELGSFINVTTTRDDGLKDSRNAVAANRNFVYKFC